jgi:RNA polymerase sigma-70 factor, ECF subfamily
VTGAATAERVARDSFGRLVALLARRSGNLAVAEDALADALLLAVARWPQEGTPHNPEGWLLTVARRKQIDSARHGVLAERAHAELLRAYDEAAARSKLPFDDERLALMLACAHPAIDVSTRTPLMLQVVLGVTAERMASLFLVAPPAMTKRLGRAKAKLAASGVSFNLPGPDQLAARIEPLLDAIYAAFTLGWTAGDELSASQDGLEDEAIWLARIVVDHASSDAEALGLLALMLFSRSRQAARHDPASVTFIPLNLQDCKRWSTPMLDEAEALLRRAGALGRPGRFQIEAAIQAVHVDRRRSGRTDWQTIGTLYERLLAITPTLGARIAQAAALTEAGRSDAAIAALDRLDPVRIASHQPYWATRAATLARLSRTAEASDAYHRAVGLTEDRRIRAYLLEKRSALAA